MRRHILPLIVALILLPAIAGATTYTNQSTGQQSPGVVPESSPGSAYSTANPLPVTIQGSTTGGITPVVSASAENNHVLKASAGELYSVSATNLTATSGFLAILNLAAAPVDGAILPLACAPLPANGNASISYGGQPPAAYSAGIVAVVTSASTCFTKTTGVITAFISGNVQ